MNGLSSKNIGKYFAFEVPVPSFHPSMPVNTTNKDSSHA